MHSNLKKQFIIFLSTGCYSGYFPVASGTFGSLVGILIYLVIAKFSIFSYLAITIVLTFTGVWVSFEAEDIFHEKDSSKIVIDEIAGMLITMAFSPFNWKFLIAGFFLFRFFDIWKKPFLALEKLPGGWGVMLDDVGAGIFANIVLQVVWLLS